MITSAYFDFFKDLSQNNNTAWFQENKKRYEKEAKEPFLDLVGQLIYALQHSTEPDLIVDPKQTMFRINRDIRFSKDKNPYKTHLAASISKYGTKNKVYPGHYLHIDAEQIFIAGGAYFFEEKETLYRVRTFIAQNPERFGELIRDPDFIKYFGTIKGEQNKRIPPEFAEAAQNQPLLANTQFYWGAQMDAANALKEDFVPHLLQYFNAAKPLNDFLIEAMSYEL